MGLPPSSESRSLGKGRSRRGDAERPHSPRGVPSPQRLHVGSDQGLPGARVRLQAGPRSSPAIQIRRRRECEQYLTAHLRAGSRAFQPKQSAKTAHRFPRRSASLPPISSAFGIIYLGRSRRPCPSGCEATDQRRLPCSEPLSPESHGGAGQRGDERSLSPHPAPPSRGLGLALLLERSGGLRAGFVRFTSPRSRHPGQCGGSEASGRRRPRATRPALSPHHLPRSQRSAIPAG